MGPWVLAVRTADAAGNSSSSGLMLALPGALLGVGLAWAAGPSILHMLGNVEAEQAISMLPNPTVLCMTVACALFCALLSGIAPAWTASHTSVEQALRSSNSRTTAGGVGLRNFFVPFQVALSLALVVVAALLGTTVTYLLMENSGYRTDTVVFALTDFLRVLAKGRYACGALSPHGGAVGRTARRGAGQCLRQFLLFWAGAGAMSESTADNSQHPAPVEAMENIITAHYFSALGNFHSHRTRPH